MAKNIHVKWKSKTCSFESIYMRTRRDWGTVNPVTKVIPDKRFKKPKHKGKGVGLMTCPNCKEYELEMYDYEDCHNGEELIQKQNLWCPGCQYHCQHKVRFKETAREVIWEEKD